MKKIVRLLVLGILISAASSMLGINSSDTYASCISSANSKYVPNNATTKAYSKFEDIDKGGTYPAHANPTWACGGAARGIYYITGLYSNGKGYKYIDSSNKYELYLNYFAPSTGKIKIGMMGQIHQPGGTVYATNVRICTYQYCDGTQTSIFSYKSGWNTGNGWGHYFKRTNGSYSNSFGGGFSYPVATAQVEVDMGKYISTYGENNLKKVSNYREGVIWVHRCYNGSGCGWSKLKFLIEGAPKPTITPRSTIKNKTRGGAETAYNTTKAKETITAHPGETVTFKHYYTLINNWTTKTRCDITFYNNGGTATTSAAPNFGNACKNGSTSVKKVDSVNRFGNAGGNFNSSGFITRDFKIPDNAANGAEYCEQIGYKNLTDGGSYKDTTEHKAVKVCAKVYRPSLIDSKSTVKTTVDGTIYQSTSGWDSSTTANDGDYVLVDNETTAVTFSHSLRRTGQANTFTFKPSIKFSNSGGSASGGAGNRTPSVTLGATANIAATTYNIKLLPEQSTTVCEEISHNDRYYADTLFSVGVTTEKSKACIKIKRKAATCKLDNSYKYGVNNGWNIGRIDATNASTGKTEHSPTAAATLQTAAGHTVAAADVWARPGDSIQFTHQGCAGAQYTVNHNSGLNNSTYRTRYVTRGSSSTGADGYLFGEKVSNVSSASPLKFSNSKTWLSTSGSDFPAGDTVILNEHSPSDTNVASSNKNVYNDKSYNCNNTINAKTFEGSHYQIAGSKSLASCNASYFTSNASDVGSTITQSIQWNNLKITNKVPNGTYNQNDQYKATASVKIPYNYNIQPAISNGASTNVVYGGSSMHISTQVYVTPRKNTKLGSAQTNTYATITKDTTSVSVEYFYRTTGGAVFETHAIAGGAYNGALNKKGNLNGNTGDDSPLNEGGYNHISYDVPVPDYLAIGTKVCARITVSPADSHDQYMAEEVEGAGEGNIALRSTGNSRKTAVTCGTVAKKPSFSVEASNTFAGGKRGFVTSTTTKNLSATQFIFGSWSEYGVFGKVAINGGRGIASGATYGYHTRNNGVGMNAVRENNSAARLSTESNTTTCTFSTLTYSNANCSSIMGSIGTNTIGSKMVEQYADRMTERHNNKFTKTIDVENIPQSSCATYGNSSTPCILANGKKYVNLSNAIDSKDNFRIRIVGNAYLGSGSNSDTTELSLSNGSSTSNETTSVIYVTGTLVIDEDIRTGTGTGARFSSDGSLSSLSDIHGNVIIANNIDVTNKVERIDSVIIASEVNTCAYNSYDDFQNNKKAAIGKIDVNECNKTIVFTGPVIAKKITLNRTAGAESGKESVKRAEIFYLGMDNYLWSYGQMGRYNQAITTYSRELPVRY